MNRLLEVPIDRIVESRWQPREGTGDPAAFESLVASVKAHGVKAPLKAFANEDGAYELVTGHRRRKAALAAGLTHVPLIVVDTPRDEAGLRALHEEVIFDNLLHEPLTPLEEARAFKALQEEGYSIRQVAGRLGKSRGYVTNRLDLLRMPEDVQRLVVSRQDTLPHAREIARVEDPGHRAELIEEAKAGASCREIKAGVDQIVSTRPHPRGSGSQTGKAHTGSQRAHARPVPEPAEDCPHGLNPAYCALCQGDDEEDEPLDDEEPVEAARPEPYVVRKYSHRGTPVAAGHHCPHCGDGHGREVCMTCSRDQWVIKFTTMERYLRALRLLDTFGRPK